MRQSALALNDVIAAMYVVEKAPLNLFHCSVVTDRESTFS